MEKINDRQVRCVVTNRDLQARKITVAELKYGSKATTELFREMVNKASDQFGFNEEELPVMIEAVPVSPEELLVIISAVEDAEEMDPHFAHFADVQPEKADEPPLEKFFDPEALAEALKVCALGFADLDQVMDFCHRIGSGYPGKNFLYRRAEGGYILILLRPEDMSGKDFNVFLNTILEFAVPIPGSALLYAYLREHEKPVMEEPLAKLSKI